MFVDYHMHSAHSNDSSYPMEDLVKKAIALKIKEICLTEHSDYGSMGDYVVDYEKYYQEYQILKEKYKEQITIKFGCEFGVQKHTIAEFEKDFSSYDFDFIILSNHQVDDKEFWTQEFQKGKTQKEYNVGYYQAILDVMENFDHYSVLGHLDMIKRYDEQGIFPDEEVKEVITKILKHAIAHEKGIEINTSSKRYNLPDLTPSRYILNLYRELGGKIITIGSDTHEEEHVGFYIEEVKKELKN
ncbi:MAG: histidinol-phosphatase HisJ family protein, partial [Coprobacillaceae bacterium]